MKNNLTYFFVMVFWVSGCATDSPIDKNIVFSPPATMMSTQSHRSRTGCTAHRSQVSQAIQNRDLDRLENLLATLNERSDCPNSYLNDVKRSMAQIAAAEAGNVLQKGEVAEAKKWLKRAPMKVWNTQVVRGDIAAHHKQWRNAAQYFNQAIDLINDPQTTTVKPTQAEIDNVFQSALDAQLLAGEVVGPIRKRRTPIHLMTTRSVNIKIGYPMPIQFNFGGNVLSPEGEKSTQKLADYIKKQRATYVTLTGHTDTKGTHRANDKISKQRSETVKSHLRKLGVNAKIHTDGKGKRKPLPLPRWKNLTKAEIDQRNRRVEFTMNSN